jgi:uncharacterized membrane protein YdbT with pleckstrin-like domain
MQEELIMGFNKNNYVWTDRKRVLGMPLSFTRYAISEDRLFVSVGFLNIQDEEILLYRVRDITTSRSLWQRIFGVGSITVVSSDKTQPNLVLKNIKNPIKTKELLHEQVEEMKIRRRVRVGEIMASGYDENEDELDLDEENN